VTDNNVFQLPQPESLLTPDRGYGAPAQAVEAEVAALLSCHADRPPTGFLPEREIMTGIGPVAVRCPRARSP
jgi:hypothetical protein